MWVDTITSPCIDTGDPTDDIGQEINPNGNRINTGAYGGTMYASKSPDGNGEPPTGECTEYPASDANNDCKVNLLDFAVMVSEWLSCNLVPIEACE